MTVTTPTPAIDQQPTGRNRPSRSILRLFAATTMASTVVAGVGAAVVADRVDGGKHGVSVPRPIAVTAAAPAAKAVRAAAGTTARVTVTPPVVDDVFVPSAPPASVPAVEPAPAAPEAAADAALLEATQPSPEADAADLAAPGASEGGGDWERGAERAAAAAEPEADHRPWSPPSTSTMAAAPPTTATTSAPEPEPDWLAPAASSQFATDLEARLIELTNAERAAAGLPGLAGSLPVAQVARAWTAAMAATGNLAHNPGYAPQIWASMPCATVAENVGYGSSLDQVHAALMASPGHRANILNPRYSLIGVGVTWDAAGILWLTQNFCG